MPLILLGSFLAVCAISSLVLCVVHIMNHCTCRAGARSRSSNRGPSTIERLASVVSVGSSCCDITRRYCDELMCLRLQMDVSGPFPWILGSYFLVGAICLVQFAILSIFFHESVHAGEEVRISLLVAWLLVMLIEVLFSTLRRQTAKDLSKHLTSHGSLQTAMRIILPAWLVIAGFCGTIFLSPSSIPFIQTRLFDIGFLTVTVEYFVVCSYLVCSGIWNAVCAIQFYRWIDASYAATLRAIDEKLYQEEIWPIRTNSIMSFVTGTIVSPTCGILYMTATQPSSFHQAATWTSLESSVLRSAILSTNIWINTSILFFIFGKNRQTLTDCFTSRDLPDNVEAQIVQATRAKHPMVEMKSISTIPNRPSIPSHRRHSTTLTGSLQRPRTSRSRSRSGRISNSVKRSSDIHHLAVNLSDGQGDENFVVVNSAEMHNGQELMLSPPATTRSPHAPSPHVHFAGVEEHDVFTYNRDDTGTVRRLSGFSAHSPLHTIRSDPLAHNFTERFSTSLRPAEKRSVTPSPRAIIDAFKTSISRSTTSSRRTASARTASSRSIPLQEDSYQLEDDQPNVLRQSTVSAIPNLTASGLSVQIGELVLRLPKDGWFTPSASQVSPNGSPNNDVPRQATDSKTVTITEYEDTISALDAMTRYGFSSRKSTKTVQHLRAGKRTLQSLNELPEGTTARSSHLGAGSVNRNV